MIPPSKQPSVRTETAEQHKYSNNAQECIGKSGRYSLSSSNPPYVYIVLHG